MSSTNDDRKPAAKPPSHFEDGETFKEYESEVKPKWRDSNILEDERLGGGLQGGASIPRTSTTNNLKGCKASTVSSTFASIPSYECDSANDTSLLKNAYNSYLKEILSKKWDEALVLSNSSSLAASAESHQGTISVANKSPNNYMHSHDEQPDLARTDSSSASTNTSCSSFARMPTYNNSGNTIENSDIFAVKEEIPTLLRTDSGNLFDAQDPDTINSQKKLYKRLSASWPNQIRTTSGGILDMLDENLVQEQLQIEEEIKQKEIKSKSESSHSPHLAETQNLHHQAHLQPIAQSIAQPRVQPTANPFPQPSQEMRLENVPEAKATPIVEAVATRSPLVQVKRGGNAQKSIRQNQDSGFLHRYLSSRRNYGFHQSCPPPVSEARAFIAPSSIKSQVCERQDKSFLRRLCRGRLTSAFAGASSNPIHRHRSSKVKQSSSNKNTKSTNSTSEGFTSSPGNCFIQPRHSCREEVLNGMDTATLRCGGCSHLYKLPSQAKNLYCPKCSTLTPLLHGYHQGIQVKPPEKVVVSNK